MIEFSPAPSPDFTQFSGFSISSPPPSKIPVDFSPPLIAMVVIIATAFILITYSRVIYRRIILNRRRWRRWRRRRRLIRSYVPSSVSGDIESASPPSYTDAFQLFSPYGLDDSSIKTIPITVYNRKSSDHECAVCLLEFDETDFVRTLPVCSHAFHVDCIDIWLRSHANCPLCRTGIFKPDSPFTLVMADRIRPSFDDMIIDNITETETEELQPELELNVTEITQLNSISPNRNRDFLLKRSYSFGFERNLGSERLILETATVSPYRFRRGGGFWSKRPSPFTSMTKPRVFSFRYYKGMKSPFFRRRGSGGTTFFPLSESSARYSNACSSRRSKSFASPLSVGVFSSSRLRSGDPEALLSPERYNRR